MKSAYLNIRLSDTERRKIREKFEGQNLSGVIRTLLLGDQAESIQPKEPREPNRAL